MRGDGNGWVVGADGFCRWGRYGAAGLLLRAPGASGPDVLVQHRALWSHHGGTWSLPGGARDSHESAIEAAVREAGEETGVEPESVFVRAEAVTATAEQGWDYTTVVADAPQRLPVRPDAESLELRWVPEREVAGLDLHPGLARSWLELTARPMTLLLDTANVLGSRADGWWRDRAGATARLLREVTSVLPRTAPLPDGGFAWIAGVDAVVEGAARDVTCSGVNIYRASGSGDDELVRVVRGDHLVVTADRELRRRVTPAHVIGPGVLVSWLSGGRKG